MPLKTYRLSFSALGFCCRECPLLESVVRLRTRGAVVGRSGRTNVRGNHSDPLSFAALHPPHLRLNVRAVEERPPFVSAIAPFVTDYEFAYSTRSINLNSGSGAKKRQRMDSLSAPLLTAFRRFIPQSGIPSHDPPIRSIGIAACILLVHPGQTGDWSESCAREIICLPVLFFC